MTHSYLGALAAAFAISAVVPAFAETPAPAPAPLTAAQAQSVADDFMAALNGDDAERDAWIARRLSEPGLKARSAAEWKTLLDQIKAQGPIRLLGVSQRGRWLDLKVEVGAAKRAREIGLRRNAADPERLDNLWAVVWPLAYPKPGTPTPTDDAGLTRALADRIEFAAVHDDFSGSALVARRGRPVYQGAFGYADREQDRHNRMDTRFSLASAGKMFTTVAIGQLIDAGKLSLDTRLVEVLPDYPNQDAARKITVRQLLSHSAGLGGFFGRPGVDGRTPFTSATEALRYFAAEPLLFEPGTAGAYSNEGFIVLGAIIEKLSGQTYYDYVAKRVLKPAGMTRSGFVKAGRPVPDLATGYSFAETDPLGFGTRAPTSPPRPSRGYRGSSAGGSYSTAGDMTAFFEALRSGRLIRPATLAAMVVRPPVGEEDYGRGFMVRTVGPRTLVGHNGGSTDGAEVNAFFVLETGDSYVLMGNYAPPIGQQLSDDVAAILAGLP